MLPASEATGVATSSSVITLRYMDEPRLRLVPRAAPGGSLNGDSSTGLTGVESENGFRPRLGEVGSGDAPVTTDRYGGGAVAVDNGRGIGSAPAGTARTGLGGVTWVMASR